MVTVLVLILVTNDVFWWHVYIFSLINENGYSMDSWMIRMQLFL